MKQARFFLFIAIVCAIASAISESQHLTVDEVDRIFDEVNRDGDSTLEDDEIANALTKAVEILFQKAKLYEDHALMEELAREYAKECRRTLSRSDFKAVVDHLPRYANTFREKTYIDILKSFEMNEILQDNDLLEEVLRRPDVYGVTYSSYKDTFGELTKVYQEALDSIQRIQKKFEKILGDAKEEPHLKGSEGKTPEEHSGIHLGDEIREGRNRVGAHLGHTGDYFRDEANFVGETISDVAQKAQDKIETATDSFKEGLQKLKQTLSSLGGRVNKNAQDNVGKAAETVDDLQYRAENTADNIAHQIHDYTNDVRAHSSYVGDQIKNQADGIGERIQHGGEDLRDSVSHVGDRIQERIEKTRGWCTSYC